MIARQMEQIEEREGAGKAFVIRPPENLKIGRTEKDPEELERVYQLGRRTASEQLDRVQRFLSGKKNDDISCAIIDEIQVHRSGMEPFA